MENVLSYHVYTTSDGDLWLSEDEKHWTPSFHASASFNDPKLAQDIGEREALSDMTVFVLACMGTMT